MYCISLCAFKERKKIQLIWSQLNWNPTVPIWIWMIFKMNDRIYDCKWNCAYTWVLHEYWQVRELNVDSLNFGNLNYRMSTTCFLLTNSYNSFIYIHNNWVKNLAMFTYLNRFVLYFQDKSLQEELLDVTKCERTSEKHIF